MKDTIGKSFMDQTQVFRLGPSEQSRGLPQPPLEDDYPPGEAIPLPRPADLSLGHVDLRAAVEARRSLRQYAEEPLTMEELSWVLWCSQGVKRVSSRPSTARTVPSAGARHAFETILLINRVAGLEAGLYRFLAIPHALVNLNAGENIKAEVVHACHDQEFIAGSAVTFIWEAVLARMRFRYGQRGYRYLLLDAGHACQNLYLAAEAINCGACAIADYGDDELNQLLKLDGEERFVVYLATLGRKLPPKAG